MPARILSLDKMLDDLRGAAAADNAKAGFVQGFQQGRLEAAAGASKPPAAQPAAQAHEQAHAASTPAAKKPTGAQPVPTDWDEVIKAHLQTLADMDRQEQSPSPQVDVGALDRAQVAQGGVVMRPGQAPPLQGAPPPPGGYGGGGYDPTAGLSETELAALEAAARNPNAAVPR
jgi:hypothetical protein